MMYKYGLVFILFTSLVSCSENTLVLQTNDKVSSSDKSTVRQITKDNPILNIPVSAKKGGIISAQIKLDTFSIKANANGTIGNLQDIKSMKIYLIKSSAAVFPAGGNPLDPANIVIGPVDVDVTPFINSIKLNFTNVPDSGSDYYHIAVRAYNTIGSTGTELIRANNGNPVPWTGDAANMKVAVSSGNGIQVNASLQVSTTTPLSIPILMTSTTGAKVNTHFKSNISIKKIKSYKINYCTDPTQPIATKVLTDDIIINSSYAGIVADRQKLQLTDLPAGNYYLTVKPFNDVNGTGSNILLNNNGGAAYTDGADQIAVSTNQVSVSADLVPSFVPNTLDYIDVALNCPLLIPEVLIQGGINNPGHLSFDEDGNLYIADRGNGKILKLDTSNNLTTLYNEAPKEIYGLDVSGTDLYYQTGSDNVISGTYINKTGTTSGNTATNVNNGSFLPGTSTFSNGFLYYSTVSTGTSTTVSKTDIANSTSTAIASSVGLNKPQGMTANATYLFIADTGNNAIKRKTISTIATGSLTSLATSLNKPFDAELSGTNLYFSDTGNNTIKKVANATAATAGSVTSVFTGLNQPRGLAIFGSDLYFSEPDAVKKIPLSGGTTSTLLSSTISGPQGIAISGTDVYFSDTGNNVIKKRDASGTVTTITINGLSSPKGIAISGTELFIADTGNNAIKKVSLTGGTPTNLVTTGLSSPWGVAVSGTDVYFTDTGNNRVKKVAITGGSVSNMITSGLSSPKGIVVNGTDIFVTDASSALKKAPLGTSSASSFITGVPGLTGLTIDATDLYFADTTNNVIKKVALTGGTVVTVGSIGIGNYPAGIAIDPNTGNVYYAVGSGNQIGVLK